MSCGKAQKTVRSGLAGVFGVRRELLRNFRYSKAMIGYARHWDDQTRRLSCRPAKASRARPWMITVAQCVGSRGYHGLLKILYALVDKHACLVRTYPHGTASWT